MLINRKSMAAGQAAADRADAAALVRYNLLRRQANIVAALLRNLLADERHWRNWTIEGAVFSALGLRREPDEEQYTQGCDLLAAIATRLEEPGTGHYRLGGDEARLLAEVLDDVLRSSYDFDSRIANAVVDGLGLGDAPTGTQYTTGVWAVEQARVRLHEPGPRAVVCVGDLLQLDFDDMIEGLAAGAYEIVDLSGDSLTIKVDEHGSARALAREEIEAADAWVDRRFVASPLA